MTPFVCLLNFQTVIQKNKAKLEVVQGKPEVWQTYLFSVNLQSHDFDDVICKPSIVHSTSFTILRVEIGYKIIIKSKILTSVLWYLELKME